MGALSLELEDWGFLSENNNCAQRLNTKARYLSKLSEHGIGSVLAHAVKRAWKTDQSGHVMSMRQALGILANPRTTPIKTAHFEDFPALT